jgi:uncharacterized protein (UPF0335 family)
MGRGKQDDTQAGNIIEFQRKKRKVTLEKKPMTQKTRVGGVAADQLLAIIQRIEKLNEEAAGIKGDISEVFAEAKGNGFDIKAIRSIIKMRRQSQQEREEEEAILHTYMNALGMLPLFEKLDD